MTEARRRRLWVEFAALYLGAPLAIAVLLPPRAMFPALFALTLAGLALLARTGGFDWRGLWRGRIAPAQVAGFGLLVGLVGLAVLGLLRPDRLVLPGVARWRLLGMIWLLYPLLSALPQELIFRPLFFHRYGALLPNPRHAVLLNATVFSFAHLMYWSVVVLTLTFAGGLIFARAYLTRGFPTAWALHAIAGNVLFTVGMGVYFWSGNVVRPF